LFFGRLTVAKQPAGGYTTYLPKHNGQNYAEFFTAFFQDSEK